MLSVHLGCFLAPATFTWGALKVCIMFSVVTMFGVSCSYHRQLSHRSFESPKWFEYLLACCGSLAIECGPIGWVSAHRHHHANCDKELDPHSPMDGFWWSHVGWMLDPCTPARLKDMNNVKDLSRQKFYRVMGRTYLLHSVILPFFGLHAMGGWPYVIWGFCVRTAVVWNLTWAVNSCAHIWGYQSFKGDDVSMNNWVLGILAFGDGWHHNHHTFPRSCRHGLKWYEFDLNWYIIKLLSLIGLARNLQLPRKERVAELALG